MSISSPATGFDLDCYRSPIDGHVWWFYSWLQNGRRRSSGSYAVRTDAQQAMRKHMLAETGE